MPRIRWCREFRGSWFSWFRIWCFTVGQWKHYHNWGRAAVALWAGLNNFVCRGVATSSTRHLRQSRMVPEVKWHSIQCQHRNEWNTVQNSKKLFWWRSTIYFCYKLQNHEYMITEPCGNDFRRVRYYYTSLFAVQHASRLPLLKYTVLFHHNYVIQSY